MSSGAGSKLPFAHKLAGSSQYVDGDKNIKALNNKFDEFLDNSTGDISVIMRIT